MGDSFTHEAHSLYEPSPTSGAEFIKDELRWPNGPAEGGYKRYSLIELEQIPSAPHIHS